LADHATRPERRVIFRRHRTWLLGMGVMTGYLGAAPSIVWASGVLFAAAFVVLVPIAIWIYTLVFAFSCLWFSHYCLAALERLREETASLTTIGPADGAGMAGTAPVALGDVQPPTS
jgi:hypothetical protein